MNEEINLGQSRADAFATTQWMLVQSAAGNDPSQSAAALESLCQRYWFPIYAFIRRRGHHANEAEDLTQAFFEHLFQHDSLKKVNPAKGKFRSYLLSILVHFLANEHHKSQAMKRGGGRTLVSLQDGETYYHAEPVDQATPEKLFDQRWAWLLVKQAIDALRKESVEQKKGEIFAKLEPALTGDVQAGWYASVAHDLGMNEGTVRVTLHRLRRRFGELLRHEIAHTVNSPAEIDDEIRQLFSAMTP